MGVHILYDPDYYKGAAVLTCSTTGVAFGPVIELLSFMPKVERTWTAKDMAFAFLRWLVTDPRTLDDNALIAKYNEFLQLDFDECASPYCENPVTGPPGTCCRPGCERLFEEEKRMDAEDRAAGNLELSHG